MRLSDQYEVINQFRQSPPVNVEGLAEALGVDVHYAYLQPETSGMLENRGGDYVITVNARDPATRRRFSLAHELGHYMLHRHLVGDGVDDDRAYRSTEQGRYHNTLIGPKEETEANRFAANVLMPHDLIEREKREKGLLELAAEEQARAVSEIAQRFGVSRHALSIRLGVPYRA